MTASGVQHDVCILDPNPIFLEFVATRVDCQKALSKVEQWLQVEVPLGLCDHHKSSCPHQTYDLLKCPARLLHCEECQQYIRTVKGRSRPPVEALCILLDDLQPSR